MKTQSDVRSFHGGRLRMLDDFGRQLLPLTVDKKTCMSLDKGPCFFTGKFHFCIQHPTSHIYNKCVFLMIFYRWWSIRSNYFTNSIAYFICSWAQSNCRYIEQFESSMVRWSDIFGIATCCYCWTSTYRLQWMVTACPWYGHNATIPFECSTKWLFRRLQSRC